VKNETPSLLFAGYVFSTTGYATASRSYIHAFHHAGIDLSVIDRDPRHQRLVPDPLVLSLLNRPLNPTFYLSHAEPQDLLPLKDVFSRLIALTTWEADTLPAHHADVLNQVMEVWVPSSYNAESFRRQLKTPVFQLPHPLHVPTPFTVDKAVIHQWLGLKDSDYVFLSVATWQERKNLPAVIEAFFRAFPADPNVILVIKTSLSFTDEQKVRTQIDEAIKRAGRVPAQDLEARLKIVVAACPEELMDTLQQRADCYVSLHHSEGWCYPLFDAACNGTPVIATSFSGPMDYLDSRYHHLVSYELEPPREPRTVAHFSFIKGMTWAEPDVAHAAALMKAVCGDQKNARARAAEGAAPLKEKYSFAAIGQMARERLLQLEQARPQP
jgi:glycosyltransferase involved in cell wall biosynthesis